MRAPAWLLLAPLVGACFLQQKLDGAAASGQRSAVPAGTGGEPGPSGSGGAPSLPGPPPDARVEQPADAAAVVSAECLDTTMRARAILQMNCAFCHQAPGREGNFDFILDFRTLMTAIGTTGKRFAVPGNPDDSRVYQRAAAGEMPPAGRMPRPSPDDLTVLRSWIQDCLGMTPLDSPDAGARPDGPAGGGSEGGPPPGCGGSGQDCCLANTCNGGGCCVLGQCRASGQACGDGVGQFGLPGTCNNGSCQNAGNVACGQPGQPCCGDTPTCTAPRATCATNQACQACGGDRQVCCSSGGASSCLVGFGCLDGGFGRVASCQLCGAMGQRCCGNGPIPQRVCNGRLVCQAAGAVDVCAP